MEDQMVKAKVLIVCILMASLSLSGAHNNILEAQMAGTWYPAQSTELTNLLHSLMTKAENNFAMEADASKIRALIVPHAGYLYSGVIAAAAYRLLKGSSFDRIIIIGPSHRQSFYGVAMPDYTHYALPSGMLPIDTAALAALQTLSPLYQYFDAAFMQEHSVEAELPFVQYCCPNTQIVPLVVGSLSVEDIEIVAASLQALVTPKTLVIISSDFIHHGARFDYAPFKDSLLLRLRQLDSVLLQDIQQTDFHGFYEAVKQTGATVCGRIPIEILLALIKQNAFGATRTRLVAYGTSADVSPHDTETVVTYASLVVTQETDNSALNMQEQHSLLRYARDTLENSFTLAYDPALLKPIMTSQLLQSGGIFVTLYTKNGAQASHKASSFAEASAYTKVSADKTADTSPGRLEKNLRGCIGRVISAQPMYQTVAEMVRAAAFHDPRFTPVTQKELSSIIIEISLLTPPRHIDSYHDIVLNKHGIILSLNGASALFLPKVAQEFGFTLEQTLNELSKKAGLPENAWQSPNATFQVFEATDFSQ
jgi:MEMO1 family protein